MAAGSPLHAATIVLERQLANYVIARIVRIAEEPVVRIYYNPLYNGWRTNEERHGPPRWCSYDVGGGRDVRTIFASLTRET